MLPRLVSRLRREDGFALSLALCALVSLGLLTASLVYYASQNVSNAGRSVGSQRARALADAGLNAALSVLYNASDPSSPSALPSPGSPQAVPGTQGTYTYSGSLSGTTWTVTGTGTARPTGGSGPGTITRTVSTKVDLVTAPSGAWSYLYSNTTSGCMDVANNATIFVSLYVRGNLCLSNGAGIVGSTTDVRVGGTLTLANHGYIGSSGSPVASVSVAGGCTGGSPNPHPCGNADGVYPASSPFTAVAKPTVDWNAAYANAIPGPNHPCTSGSVPGGFDTDHVRNGSRGTFNLTPATGYDCTVTDGQGRVVGRLAWTPGSPGRLDIAGTIFVDGSVVVSNNVYAVYYGRGTIYAQGTVTLSNNVAICGAPSPISVGVCQSSWDENTNLLVLASAFQPGNGVVLANNVDFQGAVYAEGDYNLSNNADNWGPAIANQILIDNNAVHLKVPRIFPVGAPGVSTSLVPRASSYAG